MSEEKKKPSRMPNFYVWLFTLAAIGFAILLCKNIIDSSFVEQAERSNPAAALKLERTQAAETTARLWTANEKIKSLEKKLAEQKAIMDDAQEFTVTLLSEGDFMGWKIGELQSKIKAQQETIELGWESISIARDQRDRDNAKIVEIRAAKPKEKIVYKDRVIEKVVEKIVEVEKLVEVEVITDRRFFRRPR